MWRHGDVFLAKVDKIPSKAKKQRLTVLAEGELTGHAHRIEPPSAAEVFDAGDEKYVRIVTETATLTHEEHGPIELEKGEYRAWIQREYTPQSIRRVID